MRKSRPLDEGDSGILAWAIGRQYDFTLAIKERTHGDSVFVDDSERTKVIKVIILP